MKKTSFVMPLLCLLSICAEANPIYHLTQIAEADRLDITGYAFGINDRGQVVGRLGLTSYIYDKGEIQLFEELGWSDIYDINNAGQVVGVVHRSSTPTEYSGKGCFTGAPNNLTTFESQQSWNWTPSCRAINDNGTIVGFSSEHGLTGSATTGLQKLPGGFGWNGQKYRDNIKPIGINNLGQIIGSHTINGDYGIRHAFLVQGDRLTDLGTLGGQESYGSAINDHGIAVGMAQVSDDRFHAFLGNERGLMDIGTLGGPCSFANGINNNGLVIGMSCVQNGWSLPFLFDSKSGAMEALMSLIDDTSLWQSIYVNDINKRGDIVGTGYTLEGRPRAVLLTRIFEVPEPHVFYLLVFGLLSFAFVTKLRIIGIL